MERHSRAVAPHCLFCGRFFRPYPRLGVRQKSCPQLPCRRKRKQASQKAWVAQSPAYFKGRYAHTQEWREKHPHYQRQWRRKRREIQDAIGPVSPLRTLRLRVPVEVFQSEIQDSIVLEVLWPPALGEGGAGTRDTRHDGVFARAALF